VRPIAVHRCVAVRQITEPRLSPDGQTVVAAHAFSGASMLVVHHSDGRTRQLTTFPAPRTGQGMGGGCFCWTSDGAAVVYVGSDGNLWRQPIGAGDTTQLTALAEGCSASAPCAIPGGEGLAFTVDDAEVWIRSAAGEVRPIAVGTADFCFDPFVSVDGEWVEWIEWDVPDMPWDRTRVRRHHLPTGEHEIVEYADAAVQQRRSMPDGTALFLCDAGGWLNLFRGDGPLVDEPFEHGDPLWGPGQRSFAPSPDGTQVAFTRNERGFGRLCVIDVASGAVREVARGVHGALSWVGGSLVALRSGACTPTQLVRYDTSTWERQVLAVGPPSGWDAERLIEPELVETVAADGAVVHSRLFRADPPDSHRLMVWIHGGPTDQWQVTFMPRLAYWRSLGWNVLVPDHRGSTGHGREYQQAMRGRWGELDVSDTLSVVHAAHAAGWGRPSTTVAIGGSAGGFTVLGMIAAAPERFAAAVASYPVSDLADLAERSHRFEAHYTDSLVGALPGASEHYRLRSPLNYAGALAATPLLVMHGSDDPVVPYTQSEALAAEVRAAGGTVELHCYPGEGHGWRRPEHQLDEYRRIGSFLERHVVASSA
jgi:dipeptidyl aminopeptidase/acylaminoacyl peptidase